MTVFDDSPDEVGDEAPTPTYDVFISYSSTDRERVNGLRLLLEGLGNRVFQDHVAIRPGKRWKAALDAGITNAGALVLFWTKNSAASGPVQKEYEWFDGHRRTRPLIPIRADNTPLSPLLMERQAVTLKSDGVDTPATAAFGVVNDVLKMKQDLEADGLPPDEVQKRVEARLEEAGIRLKGEKKRKFLFMFLGFGLGASLWRYPWAGTKHFVRAVGSKLWPAAGYVGVTVFCVSVVILVARLQQHLPPFSPSHRDRVTVVRDTVLLRPLASADSAWRPDPGRVDTIIRWIPGATAPLSPADWARLDSMIASVDSVFSVHEDRTRQAVFDLRTYLDSLPPYRGPERGSRFDSLVSSELQQTWAGIYATNRAVAELLGLLGGRGTSGPDVPPLEGRLAQIFVRISTLSDQVDATLALLLDRLGRPVTVAGTDLTPLQLEMRRGFARTRILIDDVNRTLEALLRRPRRPVGAESVDLTQVEAQLRTVNQDLSALMSLLGDTLGTWPSEADLSMLIRNELTGPRHTLNLIYNAVRGRSTGLNDLDTLLAAQHDTILELLQRPGPPPRPQPGDSTVIRSVRIYLPPGRGPFTEPKASCLHPAPGREFPDCPIDTGQPGGAARQLPAGEVTVVAEIPHTDGVAAITRVAARAAETSQQEELVRRAKEIVGSWHFTPGILNKDSTDVQMFAVLVFVRQARAAARRGDENRDPPSPPGIE